MLHVHDRSPSPRDRRHVLRVHDLLVPPPATVPRRIHPAGPRRGGARLNHAK